MELTPVESSHIAAIGYLEADRVLLVRYKDGALYAWRDFTADMWAALQGAPSKGAWLAGQRDGILISKGGNAGNPSTPERHGAEQTAPLNVIDEDADRCCRAAMSYNFGQHQNSDVPWECSVCGTQFYPEMVCCTRYWRIKSNVVIVRR